MTEEDWRTCADPHAMLAALAGKAGERKLRLLALASWPRPLPDVAGTVYADALDVAARFADRDATEPERAAAFAALSVARRSSGEYSRFAGLASGDELSFHVFVAYSVGNRCGDLATHLGVVERRERFAPTPGLVRDIFGNPFAPVRFAPEWRTDTAVAIARAMYASRDFSAMPILADALQDAGCDSEPVLSHCRDTSQTHVRGCWVVDRVLGKE